MREAAFELALCDVLESPETVVSRQLGAHVNGRRILDTVVLEAGPDFERERHNGRTCVRGTARYPADWFGRLVGVENKPDLGRPGDLRRQLRTDVSLGLLDAVVLATASYVTGAHLNRIPDAVGVWQFDPLTGEREVVREPTPLSPDEPGIELLEEEPGRADVRVASADAKARARRRLAERAYGKGWRPDTLPECSHCEVTPAGLPDCGWKGRPVAPAVECGPDCEGYDPAGRPAPFDADARRDDRSAWVADPRGRRRRQVGLDSFE